MLPEVSVIEGKYLRAPSRHNFVIPTEAERNERSGGICCWSSAEWNVGRVAHL